VAAVVPGIRRRLGYSFFCDWTVPSFLRGVAPFLLVNTYLQTRLLDPGYPLSNRE